MRRCRESWALDTTALALVGPLEIPSVEADDNSKLRLRGSETPEACASDSATLLRILKLQESDIELHPEPQKAPLCRIFPEGLVELRPDEFGVRLGREAKLHALHLVRAGCCWYGDGKG